MKVKMSLDTRRLGWRKPARTAGASIATPMRQNISESAVPTYAVKAK